MDEEQNAGARADARLESTSKSEPFGERVDGVLRLSAFATPVATIAGTRMRSNIAAMADWCRQRGLSLAPHGKTTMAPAIWRAQSDAGAWAITVATAAQLRVARCAGVGRVVLANPLVDPVALGWLFAELTADPAWEVLCWVDSEEAIAAMAAAHPDSARPIDVCVEVGAVGGRAGVRSLAAARAVAEAAHASPAVRLVGVSGYEGVLAEGDTADDLAVVDRYLEQVVAAHRAIRDLYETDHPVVSAGGSAYFDLVDARLGPLARATDDDVRVVIRPGVYVVHDDDLYERIAPQARGAGPELVAALHVWGRVLSRPEPELALIDVGRRDASADVGLPVPQRARRRSAWLDAAALDGASVVDLNDQHAYLRLRADSALAVGDVVRFGVSHPCTTFDKWSRIPVIDDPDDVDPRVTDTIRTYF